MNQKERIILALIQIDNLLNLTKDNQYTSFMYSHLLPVKYELERQLHCLTNTKQSSKIKK